MSAPSVSCDVRGGIGPVYLVEVDAVGVQAAQAVLDLAHDPQARVAALVRTGPHREVNLRRQDDLVAPALDGLADDLFRLPCRVGVGGVDEVDALLERAVDHAEAVVVVRVSPWAEHHRAEALDADLDAGAAERTVFHLGGVYDGQGPVRPAPNQTG